jgi:inner membrane protein
MDNLTHTLTGLMLSRAGLNRFSPRPALVLMLSANVPDIDVVSLLGGPVAALHYHRWYTHAIAMAPLMAILPVLIVCALERSAKAWKSAYVLSLIGVASHLLLDWTNTYPIRLLLPFSNESLHLDITNVIDIWIWLVLLVAFFAPMLSGLVSSEIGAKPGTGGGMAVVALALVLGYDFGRFLLHQRAVAALDNRVYSGQSPRVTAAFPSGAANPATWVGWVRNSDRSIRLPINLLQPFDPEAGTSFYQPAPSPALEAARNTPLFRSFLDFAQYPLWRSTPVAEPEGATRVDLSDWRFPFTASAIVDKSGQVQHTEFHL